MKGHSAYLEIKHGDRDSLVTQHAALVKRLAYHLITRLPPNVDVEDLIQAGMIGLLEAARHFQTDKGASFETYATIRIRGAMIDQIRRGGWAPRSLSRQMREMSDAIRLVENRIGREATSAEVAEEMGLSLDDYHELLRDTSSVRLFSLDQISEESQGRGDDAEQGGETPFDEQVQSNFKSALVKQIDNLPEKEKLVLSLYYDSGLNLKEIGEVLGVSESRACQIHGQAIVRLRSRLDEWTGKEAS